MKIGKGTRFLGICSVIVAGVVYAVHWDEKRAKNEMYAGVLRDKERMRIKRLKKELDAKGHEKEGDF